MDGEGRRPRAGDAMDIERKGARAIRRVPGDEDVPEPIVGIRVRGDGDAREVVLLEVNGVVKRRGDGRRGAAAVDRPHDAAENAGEQLVNVLRGELAAGSLGEKAD